MVDFLLEHLLFSLYLAEMTFERTFFLISYSHFVSLLTDDLLPPEYVPYVEYKSNLDIYQWIGAGRDSDAKLTVLCVTWLKNKDDVAARVVEDESLLPFVLHDEYDFKREQRAMSPASTRYPTDWVVKLSSFEEKEDFRKQVRKHYLLLDDSLISYAKKWCFFFGFFFCCAAGKIEIPKSEYSIHIPNSRIPNGCGPCEHESCVT